MKNIASTLNVVGGEGEMLCWLMLNPSTADEMVNDNTIERCQRRAIAMGFQGIAIVNLFPYRMTHSNLLHTVNDLLGEEAGQVANNYILSAINECEITVCGWGSHKLATQRAKDILELISGREYLHKIHYLVLNKNNSPRHPTLC